MFEARDLKQDLFALALLVLVVFLACALVTYDPADPLGDSIFPLNHMYQPDTLVHPPNDEVSNASGHWGALVADMLLNALGWGGYYLVFSLSVVTVLLLMRRKITAPILRTVGWIGSLIGLTTIVAMLCPGFMSGPVIGAGGYLGALGHGLLEMHFATFGGFIIALSLVIGGLLLCTDYVLVHLLVILSAMALDRASGRRQPLSRRKRAGREKEQEDTDSVSVRIRGKKIGTPAQEDDEGQGDLEYAEKEEQSGQPEEAEVEEAGPSEEDESKEEDQSTPMLRRRGKRRRLLPSPRIRKSPEDEESARDEVMQQLDEASRSEDGRDYELPSMDLLLGPDDFSLEDQAKEVRRKAKILEKTLANFGFQVKVVEIETGPVIAQYEVALEAGLRLSRITGLADDLAIALRVPSVRIVAPIPGKNTVGIEVPNEQRQIVRLYEVMEEMRGRVKKMRIPLFLGKDVSGNPLAVDLSTLPHLLIAGRTGTGKSVCLNAIITSILMTRRPDEVRMLMIDPKMVELSGYKSLPHLMHPVVTDMRKAEAILAWAVDKMEERYELLARTGVRHMGVYNQLGEEELMERLQPEDEEQRKAIPLHMPYIVIVVDELADLMMTSGKEVEQHIIRLAQKSRAVGIHLILATQKPTVDVITGLIKSNLPARIAFQVASRTDSRVVLDEMGADKLLGSGDMLFLWPGTSTLVRGQGTFLSDEEIRSIVDVVSTGEQNFVKELVQLKVEDPSEDDSGKLKKRDELYENAVDVVVREGRGSVSLLQRALGIGYGRAARLVDYMAEDGIVGGYAGSQAREVLISMEDWQRMQGSEVVSDDRPAKRPKSNKVLPENDSGHGEVASAMEHATYEEDEEIDDEDEYCDEEDEEADEDAGVEDAGVAIQDQDQTAQEEEDVEEDYEEDEIDQEDAYDDEDPDDEDEQEVDEVDDEYDEDELDEDPRVAGQFEGESA